MSDLPDGYELVEAVPSAPDFCALRVAAGLSAKSLEAARLGLPNSYHSVTILYDGVMVGMGRIVGDGGTAFQITDMAVHPAHQGRGLGKAIMANLVAHLRNHAPSSAYVSLIADGPAQYLYAQYGFQPTMPDSIGMALRLG